MVRHVVPRRPAGRSSSRVSARSSASCASAVRPLCRAVRAASREPPGVPSISSVGDARSVATTECVLNRGPLRPWRRGQQHRRDRLRQGRMRSDRPTGQVRQRRFRYGLASLIRRPHMVCSAAFISESAAWANERGVCRDAVAGPATRLQWPLLASQRHQPVTRVRSARRTAVDLHDLIGRVLVDLQQQLRVAAPFE